MMDAGIVYHELKKSRKYRYLCDETLNRISEWALQRFEGKKAIKAAKNKLHQVYGAYIEAFQPGKIQNLLEKLPVGADAESLKSTAMEIMKSHSSTAERLPFMEQLYNELFRRIGPPRKVLDLACGLNPFAVQWMNLGPGVEYRAYDIDTRLIAVINTFFVFLNPSYKAYSGDLLLMDWKSLLEKQSFPPYPGKITGILGAPIIPLQGAVADRWHEVHSWVGAASPLGEEADVVFLLKALPCLEQQEKGSGEKIIAALKAKHIVISFPSRSLGGKAKGMEDYYHGFILEILGRRNWDYFKLEYPNEIFYVVDKR